MKKIILTRSFRFASVGLQFGYVLMALTSLHPYFMWGHQKTYYAISTVIVCVSYAACFRYLRFSRFYLFLAITFSFFLIYLSVSPKVSGGITRWYFLIPFTFALLTTNIKILQNAFETFYWAFACSLIPGMFAWIWLATGLPLEVNWMTVPALWAQRPPVDYIALPGAVFLEYNAMLLPNGGTIFRLCGMLDEPGTIGTVAALCLAATRYRLNNFRGAVSFVAGLMSFSIAFGILTIIGTIATAFFSKRPGLLIATIVSGCAILIPIYGVTFDDGQPHLTTMDSRITVVKPRNNSDLSGLSEPILVPESYKPYANMRLRQATQVDNRAGPEMQLLFERYLQSPLKTLLFGISSNASSVYAGNSSSWHSVLINHGAVGFTLLFLLFFIPLIHLRYIHCMGPSLVIFVVLFAMSFYQRPMIWLPAQILIYFVGLRPKPDVLGGGDKLRRLVVDNIFKFKKKYFRVDMN